MAYPTAIGCFPALSQPLPSGLSHKEAWKNVFLLCAIEFGALHPVQIAEAVQAEFYTTVPSLSSFASVLSRIREYVWADRFAHLGWIGEVVFAENRYQNISTDALARARARAAELGAVAV